MLKVGDMVKVINTANVGGVHKELIKIGTICTVLEVCQEDDGSYYYGISEHGLYDNYVDIYYYLEEELEKGHLEWIKE